MKKLSENSTNLYVGRRIKIRRQSLGYTLDDVAIKTGISTQMCSKYERGVIQIPPYALLIISLTLSIPVDLLFPERANSSSSIQKTMYGDDLNIPEPAIAVGLETDLYHRKETVDLVKAFYGLPTPELRRVIRAMVRSIAAELPRGEAFLSVE